jgi:hypothetical protein
VVVRKEVACKEAPTPQPCNPTEEAEAMDRLVATVAAEDNKPCAVDSAEAMAVPADTDIPCVATEEVVEATVVLVAMEAMAARVVTAAMVALVALAAVDSSRLLLYLHRPQEQFRKVHR